MSGLKLKARGLCVFVKTSPLGGCLYYIILKYSLSLVVICLQDIICAVVTEECGYFILQAVAVLRTTVYSPP